jgi:cytochrome c553
MATISEALEIALQHHRTRRLGLDCLRRDVPSATNSLNAVRLGTLLDPAAYTLCADIGRGAPAACMSCHGENAEGSGPISRLAGQHRAYLARQLEAFASMARANEIMHENSKNLTPEQISEVTAYLATQ